MEIRNKNRQLKSKARGNLLGHYAPPVLALLFTLIIGLVLNIPFSNMISQGRYFHLYTRVVIGIIGIVVVMIIVILFSAGSSRIHLLLARGAKAKFGDILYPFTSRPGRFVVYYVLFIALALVCVLPGFICFYFAFTFEFGVGLTVDMPVLAVVAWAALIAGLIVYYINVFLAWSMGVYLLLDYPDMRLRVALRESRQMMSGNKWALSRLYRSLLGWIFFSILSFGIALLWILPYMIQSSACFYLSLLPEDQRTVRDVEQENNRSTYR